MKMNLLLRLIPQKRVYYSMDSFKAYLFFWFLLVVTCHTHADDVSWQWPSDLEKAILKADTSVQNIELGSYWDTRYRAAVFSVANSISIGWSSRGFNPEIYNTVLNNIWNNTSQKHLLNDNLIRLSSLTWRLNLKNRCFDANVNKSRARKYIIEMIYSDENVLKDSAISGLGLLGEREDVDMLIELLINNQNTFVGSSALSSLLLVEGDYALEMLRTNIQKVSNDSLKQQINEELSFIRVSDDKCAE